ncbi:FMN-binding negative transcriptional regulator [Shewanella sp. 202IG2-18]|uniref:FMN-binding negative transcriptional regulator n=1 Tax=Parashewanella hymeniacidonis TaxID=2807618 RepID=UPI00195FFA59|nr:FMN-binding negative transcriptional regulator [Parashewanella hymeniacidonis]MBM7072419.1 FMN-binding negative transcriptional regulator [Parashewanella hymeniacidonis]
MHVPEKWSMETALEIQQFIDANGFAVLITKDLEATHLPLIIQKNEGELGMLYGHIARNNTHLKSLGNAEVLVVFSGAHSYISPTWYDKTPAVPTWNYSSVHAFGKLEFTDEDITKSALFGLIEKYEPHLLEHNDQIMPDEYLKKLSNGIVGFKVKISKLQGKEKLGQHRSVEDQMGVVSGLAQSDNSNAKSLLEYMQQRKIGCGV